MDKKSSKRPTTFYTYPCVDAFVDMNKVILIRLGKASDKFSVELTDVSVTIDRGPLSVNGSRKSKAT